MRIIPYEEGIEGITLDKKSKIILPRNLNTNRCVFGEVLGVGRRVHAEVKEGDLVILRQLCGIPVYNGNLVHEEIVYAKWEDEKLKVLNENID